jgi:hypothetical protein
MKERTGSELACDEGGRLFDLAVCDLLFLGKVEV